MVVKPEIMEELYMDAGVDRIERAREYVRAKRVQITKVIYENKSNFEIRSKVRGSGEIYDVYIKVENGEIQDVSCDCPDYNGHYATCKHILATIIEFNQNSDYIKIFSGDNKLQQTDISLYQKYNIISLNAVNSSFYPDNTVHLESN